MRSRKLTAFIAAAMLMCGAGTFSAYAAASEKAAPPAAAAENGGTVLLNIGEADFSYTNSFVFNGLPKTPKVTVRYAGRTLTKDKDYSVKYSSNTKVGKGYATVTGRGNYTGIVKLEFEIKAPAVKTPAKLRCSDANLHIMCIRWNAVKGADGYQLEYYNPKTSKWTGTKNLGASKQYYKYDSSSLAVGTTYPIRIRSHKTVAGQTFYSDWATAYATTDPGSVSGIKQSSANTRGYTLTWNAAEGAMKYEVLRWSPVTGKYEVIATVGTNKYVVKDRTPGQKNTYKVRAIRTVKGSSTVFHGVKTSYKATAACDVVRGITATVKRNWMTVTWDPAEKASSYEVYYTDARGNNPVTLATVNNKTFSYTTNKLVPGRRYKIKVKAISKYGTAVTKSAYPAGVSFTVFSGLTNDQVLDSYVNAPYVTVTNSNGYTIPEHLKAELSYQLTRLGGTVSYALLDIESGTLISSQGKTYMGTASTVKMPFMLYSLHEMEDGWPTMDTEMVYSPQDYCSGSGVIQNYSFGTVLTLEQIFSTIFTYSDNIGLYMLQRMFGIDGYNRFIRSIGCRPSMSYYNRWGYVCATDSAKEWLRMYDYFSTGRYGRFMREGFTNSCASSVRNALGHKYTVYSKCGWTEVYNHDTTVVEAEHPYVLIAFTDRSDGYRLAQLAVISDQIHDDMWNYFING